MTAVSGVIMIMRRVVLSTLSACFMLFSLSTQASTLTTTYSYAGNPFTNFHGSDSCPSECSITGYFVVAGPPPTNLSGSDTQFQFDVTPLNYSFSDGLVTATPTNSNFDFFSISTNGAGEIVSWTIRLFTPPCEGCVFTGTQLLTSDIEDITIVAPAAVDFAAALQNPGTWSITVNSAVPEPSTWAMLLIGFAGIGSAAYCERGRQYTLIPSAVVM
jgi:hypothetical protein